MERVLGTPPRTVSARYNSSEKLTQKVKYLHPRGSFHVAT